MNSITRPAEGEFAPYAKVYVDHVETENIVEGLANQIEKTVAVLRPIGEERSLFAYQPGKWTIKETIGHLSDTERVLSYRVLRIARGDTTPLPGFQQDDYVATQGANERRLEDLLHELAAVRQATLALMRSLPKRCVEQERHDERLPCNGPGSRFYAGRTRIAPF